MTDNENQKIIWKYCPSCGHLLPSIERIRYCIKCGVDLYYIKKHKTLPPRQEASPYVQPRVYPYPPVYYKPDKRMSKDEILDTKDKKLWGNFASIGVPLLAFIAMNGTLIGLIIAIILLSPDIELTIRFLTSPLFLVFATFAELLLILFPLLWVRKYLQNPNLKNRLIILGFTTKGYDNNGVLKEIGIGIGFAFIGLGVVVGASLAIRSLFRLFFEFEESTPSDADVLITGFDVFLLILMIIMMIIIVGPCEEILFRGFMQRGLVRNLGDIWGIILTALIFAAIHLVGLLFFLINPIIFLILFIYFLVPYFAISLLLGLVFRWRNENLITVIVTHGVYNSLTLLISFLYMVFY